MVQMYEEIEQQFFRNPVLDLLLRGLGNVLLSRDATRHFRMTPTVKRPRIVCAASHAISRLINLYDGSNSFTFVLRFS